MKILDLFKNYITGTKLEIASKEGTKVKPIVRTTNGMPKSLAEYISDLKQFIYYNPPKDIELLQALSNDLKSLVTWHLESIPNHTENDLPKELQGLSLNCDLTNPKKLFLTLPDGSISLVNAKVFLSHFKITEDAAPSKARLVYTKYDPRMPKGITNGQVPGFNEQVNILNIYSPAQWKAVPDQGKTPDQLFFNLINHLFPVEKDRKFVLYWLRKSLVDRAKTFLMLCGVGGVGKNRLKLLFTALHGATNSVDGKKSTLTTQFNSQLANNTLMWFDELRFGESEENVMKEMPNETASIEAKFHDSTSRTQLFGSYVISNNKPRDNYISMDARKFCPVVLNNKRLETSMTIDEIGEFSSKVDLSDPNYDNEYVATIGHWIINNCDSEEFPLDEYKGKMFHILTHTSMTRWQKRTISIITNMKANGEVFEIDKIAASKYKEFLSGGYGKMHSSSFEFLFESIGKYNHSTFICPELSTVEAFLANYRDLAGQKVCEITRKPNALEGNFTIERLDVEEIYSDIPFDIDEDFDNIDPVDVL